MTERGADAVPAELRAALEDLAGTETLLVALDFDGVLAPIVPRAEDARPLPASAAAVAALADLPRTSTAFISGRALASLRAVASPDRRTLLIGSHGGEVFTGPDSPPLVLDEPQQRALTAAAAVVEKVVAAHPGTRLEAKPAGVVLHTRTAADDVAAAATEQARAALQEIPGLQISDGKRVLETSVLSADKGQGIGLLRSFTGATAVFFAGDDVTDEHAFAVLRDADVGIKVGPGSTAAQYRVESPQSFAAALALLAELRAAALQV
ncbi:MAG: trehalose-phosphatase [Actinomycetota bacterium]